MLFVFDVLTSIRGLHRKKPVILVLDKFPANVSLIHQINRSGSLSITIPWDQLILFADRVCPARRRGTEWLSKQVRGGLGAAGIRHVGHAVYLRCSDNCAHFRLFTHLSGSLAQRAIQSGRLACPAFVVDGHRGAVRGKPGQPRWTHLSRQSTDLDDSVERQAEDRQTDAGRCRQLHRLLRTVLRRADVGCVGRKRAVRR